MHSFAHHLDREAGEAQAGLTRGHVLNWGWRYDLMLWWSNLMLHGKWQALEEENRGRSPEASTVQVMR